MRGKVLTSLVVVIAAWLIAGPPPLWVALSLGVIMLLVALSMLMPLLKGGRRR